MDDTFDQVLVERPEEWRAWLAAHHDTRRGVWVVTWKRGSGRPQVGYEDLIDEAVAFGWVDSRVRRLDDERSALLVTPRRPTSAWSASNKRRVERLSAEGRMQPAGLDAVQVARASGRWDGVDSVEVLSEPAGLAAALDATPAARRHWDAFPRHTRSALLRWLAAARTEGTRTARIERIVTDAAAGLRVET